jgi:hypothetical protein
MPSLKFAQVSGTEIKTSSPGFVGVLSEGQWYPNEAKAKSAEEGEEVPANDPNQALPQAPGRAAVPTRPQNEKPR